MAKMRAAQITDPNGPVELSSAKYPNPAQSHGCDDCGGKVLRGQSNASRV
jgi:hypothetical protein